VNGVATKLGAGLGAAALGLLMGLSGYDGSAAVQSDSAITMIRFLYAGLPAITTALCAIVMHFYDLDSKLPEINAELERRGAAEEKL
jgi:Na+/melibiose symporter-like transporter